jgi:hypothetical protein
MILRPPESSGGRFLLAVRWRDKIELPGWALLWHCIVKPPMKPRNSPDEQPRFQGPLRHYHRTGTKPEKSWDEWIDGSPPKTGSPGRRWRTTGVILATLALAAIIAGLIIELS